MQHCTTHETHRFQQLVQDFARSMTTEQLSVILRQFGCPEARVSEMASQLDKRATQLAQAQGRSYEESLAHLLNLMKQGWSAKERGL